MPKAKVFSPKELTKQLRKMAMEVHDQGVPETDDEGRPVYVNRAEAVARLMWKQALGWTQIEIDDEGKEKKTYHKPVAWCLQMVYERLEGRTPQAISEDEGRLKAAEQVGKLSKDRLNALATAKMPTLPPIPTIGSDNGK